MDFKGYRVTPTLDRRTLLAAAVFEHVLTGRKSHLHQHSSSDVFYVDLYFMSVEISISYTSGAWFPDTYCKLAMEYTRCKHAHSYQLMQCGCDIDGVCLKVAGRVQDEASILPWTNATSRRPSYQRYLPFLVLNSNKTRQPILI